MNICIIPARGGSKRIPRKNIRLFCGKPIIAYSIEAAIASNCFEHIIVSTDDNEISEIAKKYGAEVPFKRPSSLSDDHTGTIPVITHAIEQLELLYDTRLSEKKIKNILCLYATAPLLKPEFIQDSYQLMQQYDADYCFSAGQYPFPVQRSLRRKESGFIEMLNPHLFNTRSQDLEPIFHDAGQFYWGKKEAYLEGGSLFSKQSYPYILPRWSVQDIDNEEDWLYAEKIYNLSFK